MTLRAGNRKIMYVLALIFMGAMSRLIPHPPNFTPVAAMAVIGGIYLNGVWSWLLPIGIMFVSDLIMELLYRFGILSYPGIHAGIPFVYGAFLLIVLVSRLFARKEPNLLRVTVAGVAGSVLFFLVTNAGVWLLSDMYPAGIEGLLMSYYAAIPFFRNTLLSTLLYTWVMYGVLNWLLGYAYMGSRTGMPT